MTTITPSTVAAHVARRRPSFVLADVKSVLTTEDGPGEFELVMSTDSVDRDGERIVSGAFNPLPASIPVHAFHDFHDPVGRVAPRYDEKGRLVGRGFFASTARAQEIRQLVADGVIGHSSVGFMAAERKAADGDGPPEVASAELLEVSFVSVPSNRDAAVLMVKELDAVTVKVGARNAAKDQERIQAIHDHAVNVGAVCAAPDDETPKSVTTSAPETPTEEVGKSPASAVVEWTRNRAASALLMVPTG